MPKSENVSGISAAIGMLRPKMVSGSEEGVDPGEAAAQDAERHADERRQAEARAPRAAGVASVLRVSSRSNHRLGKAVRTSPPGWAGPWTATGSAPPARRGSRTTRAPKQSAMHEQRRAGAPARAGPRGGARSRLRNRRAASDRPARCRPAAGGGGVGLADRHRVDSGVAACRLSDAAARSRAARRPRAATLKAARHCFSAEKTFTSTRRFLAWLSGSFASAGRSQPMPSTVNWLGSRSVNFLSSASLTALARFSDSSLTSVGGHLALHRAVGVPLDDDAGRCRTGPASLAISSSTRSTFGSYSSSTVLPSTSLVTFLCRSQLLG